VDEARHLLCERARGTESNGGAVNIAQAMVDCVLGECIAQRCQRAGIADISETPRNDRLAARSIAQPTPRHDTGWWAIIWAIDFCQRRNNGEVGPKAS
jgi:hypothetical protein